MADTPPHFAYVLPPSLEATVRQYVEALKSVEQLKLDHIDARTAYRDHQVQLGAMNISLGQVRAEVLQRLDTLESKVLVALNNIALKLSMNGSGS